MTKQHGQVNHELMEDRSVELYEQIQQLSMQLLGTLGNKPGPTAETAQLEYNRMIREQESRRRKREGNNSNDEQSTDDGPVSMVGNNNPLEAFQKIFKQNVSGVDSFGDSDKQTVKIGERIEDLLECKLCHKMIINRTRGLHILHHARNDLGLIRYQCTKCDFIHERSQSIATVSLLL
jgi:ribosomal protein L44E